MSAISDRTAAKRRMVEVLTHASGLETVKTFYDIEGASTANEAIWLGEVTGVQEMDTFGSPRPGRSDRWNLRLAIAVTGFANTQDADARCQEIVTAACEALFTGDRLGDGWSDAALYPGRIDGPNGFRMPKQPASSFTEMTIEVLAAIRGS